MARSKAAEHTHKYLKLRTGLHRDYVVFKCVLPACSHYVHESLIVGRESLCWRCGKPFQMFGELARRTRPHCKSCTERKTNVKEVARSIRKVSAGDVLTALQTRLSAADKFRPALPGVSGLPPEDHRIDEDDEAGNSDGENAED